MLSGHLPFWDGPFPNKTQMAPLVINCRFFWGCLNSWQLEGTKATHKRVLCSHEPLWGLSSCSTPLCFATPALARTQGKQLLPHAVPVAGEVRCDLIFLLCGSAVLQGSSGAGKQQVVLTACEGWLCWYVTMTGKFPTLLLSERDGLSPNPPLFLG